MTTWGQYTLHSLTKSGLKKIKILKEVMSKKKCRSNMCLPDNDIYQTEFACDHKKGATLPLFPSSTPQVSHMNSLPSIRCLLQKRVGNGGLLMLEHLNSRTE